MDKLKEINGRYYALYSFFRSMACYDALTDHLGALDSPTTHPYTHIYNILIQDAFLSWCKVFGANAEDCHWKKLLKDHDSFRTDLYTNYHLSKNKFEEYWKSVIIFRNNWVVHFGPGKKQKPTPNFDIAFKSAKALFVYLTKNNKESFEYRGPNSIEGFIEGVKKDFLKQLKI